MTTSSNDDATDRRLRLLIGLVVVVAVAVGGTVASGAYLDVEPIPPALLLLLLVFASMLASHLRISVRIKSTGLNTTWGEIPLLVSLALIPGPWVVFCAVLAVALSKIITRGGLMKGTFAVAKETLLASAAAVVFGIMGVQPSLDNPPFAVLPTVLAMLAIVVVDTAVYMPVVAIASRSPIRQIALNGLDTLLIGYVVRLGASILIIGILASEATLLLAVLPFVVACMHLWQSRQVRTREERESWQRLAEATDALNAVDLTRVLHSAVSRATVIFSATEAEVDLGAAGTDRVVIGTADHVRYDGSKVTQPSTPAGEVTADLIAHGGSLQVGVLRLRFGGSIKLTEFEQYKLKVFASALTTAIRNASAYAELERLNEQNAYDASHDPLTGLMNRRSLYERAEESFREGRKDGIVALLLIDLNHFKEVNDTLGHPAGDAVLQEVAHRLDAAAMPGDLVARLGGDEFAVLLVNLATPALATHRAKNLLSALEPSLEVEGMQITVEAAAGIALAPGSGGVSELMRRADVAMYQAKRAGQQTATYAHAQDTADVGRLMLGGELQRAVAEHEFVVDFQPIVDLGSGEVISAEALARWQHPVHGYLTPMAFLETVERSGQLPAFAEAVLSQALSASDVWREAGFDLPIAVNVSPRSLLDTRFPEMVLACLQRHGIPAERLTLELTETLTISQLDVVGRALTGLRAAGVRLAIDGFGTGVSSLSVLSHIPVQELKIDRDFVGAVETSTEAAAVIRSTVDLARSLHLTVIAEGVESEPQRHALWELGCVAGQGHLFARPMSATRLLAALQRGSAGRPGILADALHDVGAVVRMPRRRTASGSGRQQAPPA